MDRQVGILVMRDENDILEEYLNKVVPFYDKILVLDGSDDNEGENICSKFSEVIFYEKDKNVIKGKSNDSIRGFLWEQAKTLVNDKHWVAVLHPDEFPEGNPLDVMEEHKGATSIAICNMHFFLHTSQKDGWSFEKGDLIEPRMKWYMAPGWTEYRYFKFDRKYKYNSEHGWVIPPQSLEIPVHTDFRHKQYSYRSRDQVLKRAITRWESDWQQNDYCLVLETNDIFFDTLKYPESYREKYPKQYQMCWYNSPDAYVAKLDD